MVYKDFLLRKFLKNIMNELDEKYPDMEYSRVYVNDGQELYADVIKLEINDEGNLIISIR